MKESVNILVLALFWCLVACSQRDELNSRTSEETALPNASKETVFVLKKEFPGIQTGPVFADSILHYINEKYSITADQMLLGASTCVDDIIYTKNFRLHKELKGPFHLGGLAGLPFTGASGLDALAHHIPDDGTMLLLITPHIGFSESKAWGYVLRHEQHNASTCCGALMNILEKLQNGTITPAANTEDDYQGEKIAELALHNQQKILGAQIPIIELTKLISKEAERQIRAHVLNVNMTHIKYIIIISGVMINTDYLYSDYFSMNHFMVYDVRKKKFVEEFRKPDSLAP